MKPTRSNISATRKSLIEGLKDFDVEFELTSDSIQVSNYELFVVGSGVVRVVELNPDGDKIDEFICSVDEFLVNV